MRIDIHTHAFHPKIADKVLAQLSEHYGIVPVGSGLAGDLLERLDRAGLDGCVVHSAATAASQVIPANNWAIELQRSHSRITAFGTLHPDFEGWEAQLDRLEENGIRGIKLHPDFQGFALDDPRLDPMFEAMRGRFAAMIHVGDRLPPEKNPSCPFKFMRIHERHPELRLIAAHLGGYLHWTWALECLIGHEVFIDSSSSAHAMDMNDLAAIFARHPREYILFGSDYPLFDPAREAERLAQTAHLSDTEILDLQHNAAAFLQSLD